MTTTAEQPHEGKTEKSASPSQQQEPEPSQDAPSALKINPKLYRQLQEPFASMDALNAALAAFWEELYALRVKHRIADMHIIARATYGEDEQVAIAAYHMGDSAKAFGMLGAALVREKDSRVQAIAEATQNIIDEVQP